MSIYTNIRARRSVIDTVTLRAVSQASTLLGYVILVRAMRKEDFGVFNLLYSFIPVVSTLASFGLEQTLRRFQPEYLAAGNTAAATWLVRFVASARFGSNVMILALLLAAWNHLAPIFQMTPYRGAFLLFSLLILMHFQVQILQMTLASHMLHRYSVGAVVVLSIAKLIAYALLAALGSLTLERAILGDLSAYGLAYVFLRIVYRLRCRPAQPGEAYRPTPAERKRLFHYGLYNNFNDAGTLLLDVKLDNFFIAAFIDPVSVGIYAFYTRIIEMAGNLSPLRLFDNVIQPLFFATRQAEAESRIPQYFTLLLNLNFAPQWPILAFSLAYHAELVRVVFAGKFIAHSWLLPLIALFSMINSIAVPVTLVAQYEERVGVILLSKVTAAYNIAAMLVLVPLAGLYGAVLARGSAVALKNLFIWWHVRRTARWMNAGAFLASGTALWGGVALACIALKNAVSAPPVVHLACGVMLCAAALLVYLRTPALSRSDRDILGTLFHGREARTLERLGILKTLGHGAAAQ